MKATVQPMRRPNWAGSIGLLLVATSAVAAGAPGAQARGAATCAAETDDARRLACYDSLFGHGASSEGTAEGAGASKPVTIAPALSQARAPDDAGPAPRPLIEGEGVPAREVLSRFWELRPEDKRGTFVVRTFQPNLFLPAHWTNHVNHSPTSPTHPDGGNYPAFQPTEAELQVSLRTKALEDVLLPHADLWLAYTQKSIWQLWNHALSSPFRSSDYEPEMIYVVPIAEDFGQLPGDWHWRMATLSLTHQSNGQSDPLSRSWNRASISAAFDHADWSLQARWNYRLHEKEASDDNPDLLHYIGATELSASWYPGLATLQLNLHTNLTEWKRGSQQVVWTRPLFADKPDGLRWYVQLFHGYGETLLDYNHAQTTIGVGFTLFQL